MTIHEILEKCKSVGQSDRVFMAVVIVLVGVGSFGLGRLSKIEAGRRGISIEAPSQVANVINTENKVLNSELGALNAISTEDLTKQDAVAADGQVVASKNGTKYHFPWCAGAKSISEQNKIFFPSAAAARAAGYTPATNCKGLK
jgi:hypothetical protein